MSHSVMLDATIGSQCSIFFSAGQSIASLESATCLALTSALMKHHARDRFVSAGSDDVDDCNAAA